MSNLTFSKNNFFVNPYNFVQQSIKVDREQKQYNDPVSGAVSCRVIVKTELALPDHEQHTTTNAKGEKYDFFNIGGKPVIPGSEIRGCIRNIYETLTGSCFSVLNANTLTKRVSVSWKDIASAGIVKYEGNEWHICPARKISKEERETTGKVGIKRKWKASPMIKRISFLTQFYDIADETVQIPVSEKKMNGFMDIIDEYLKNNKTDKEFINCINTLKNSVLARKPFVAFYKTNKKGKLTYFSPAQLGGRTAYEHTVSDLLGNYSSCTAQNGFCPACRLFGTVSGNEAIASKIRFSDAEALNGSKFRKEYVMLPPLSSPKTTSVEFYSVNSAEKSFNDVSRWDYDSPGIELRGRKFYFHSTPQTASPETDPVTGQFATKTALKGSEFRFNVYFDNISEKEQLSKLLWSLTLGENDENSSKMQKIGAGKPVGYGSIKIVVDNVSIRSITDEGYTVRNVRYADEVASETVFDAVALNELKQITDFNYVLNNTVSYPIADDGTASKNARAAHKWFSTNRPQKEDKFMYVLPVLSEKADNLLLPAVEAGTVTAKENDDAPICPICKKNKCNKNKKFGGYYRTCVKCSGKTIQKYK